MESNLIAGLVSGVIVTLLVVVFSKFWNSVIIPWFEDRVYKDIRIEGKWFVLYPSSPKQRQELVVLKRHGHAITGEMVCVSGYDEGEQYKLDGSFRNLLLPLMYESTDKQKSDRGTITLKCIMNGTRLSGKIAAYDSEDEDIVTANVLWFRSKEDLGKTIEKIKTHEERIMKISEERKRISKEESEIENIDSSDIVEENEPKND